MGLTRSSPGNGVHRPSLSYGVAVLEPAPGETSWKHSCPLQKRPLPIESIDEGAHYYRRYFLGKRETRDERSTRDLRSTSNDDVDVVCSGRDHQNWFGMDEQLGPVAISIRKDANQYRIIVRTSELLTLRGSVPEEALGGIRPQGRLPTRELLELVAPEVQLGCLRLGTPTAEEALARLDEQGLSNKYKVGVLYCRSGQRTEEEMYNNQHAGPAFLEFLDTIGETESTQKIPFLSSFRRIVIARTYACVTLHVYDRSKNQAARIRRVQGRFRHENRFDRHPRSRRDL